MAFDLDDEELKATRILNGADKKMNIEEAIERMHDLIHTCNAGIEKYGIYDDLFQKDKEAIETVLNMLKEKDKEIANLKNEINEAWEEWNNLEQSAYEEETRLKDEIKKKDKQIDLMAEYINEIDVSEEICEGKTMCDENCKECIKQYFESKAEKE